MKRIEMVEEAAVWYRLWSNQAHLLAIVTYAQMALPFWEGVIPEYWFGLSGALLNTAGVILRNIKQPGLKRGDRNV